jgi:hypothetical protein
VEPINNLLLFNSKYMYKRIYSYLAIFICVLVISCSKDDEHAPYTFVSQVDVSESSLAGNKYNMILLFSTDDGATFVDYPVVKPGQSFQVKVARRIGSETLILTSVDFTFDWSESTPAPAAASAEVAEFTLKSKNDIRVKIKSCSDLGGTIDYVHTNVVSAYGNAAGCGTSFTGTVDFIDHGFGEYEISDITFGQYDCAWGDNPASGVSLHHVCASGELTLTGTDQYGLVYTITKVSNDGTTLVLDWANDYGDGGRVALTRTGGWPTNLATN